MTDDMDWTRALLAGATVGAALAIEHLLCYDESAMRREPELVLLGSNVLGTATIAVGVALAAPHADEVARHLTIAAIGGAVVVVVRIARRITRMRDDAAYTTGHAAGRITGANGYERGYRTASGARDRAA